MTKYAGSSSGARVLSADACGTHVFCAADGGKDISGLCATVLASMIAKEDVLAGVTNISIVHVTLRAQCRLYVSHVMFRLKPHPRQTVAAVVKVCRLWLGRSGVEKCRVDHKIGSKTFMVAELLAKASS